MRRSRIALVHGNGPQIGLLALEAEAYEAAPGWPLDVLGAESQGMVGYVIAQALRNARAIAQAHFPPLGQLMLRLLQADSELMRRLWEQKLDRKSVV